MFFRGSNKSKINWREIANENDLANLLVQSNDLPCLIFKHSTRCSISTMAKSRLERNWEVDINLAPYYLDLLNHREISDKIAMQFNVVHQSPQVLLISKEKCEYNSSHNEISFSKIKEKLL